MNPEKRRAFTERARQLGRAIDAGALDAPTVPAVNREHLKRVLDSIVADSADDDVADHLQAVVDALRGNGLVFVNPPLGPDDGPIVW